MSFAPSEMYVTFDRWMIQSLISTAKVTNQGPIASDASDLAVNAYRRPGDLRSLSGMAIIHLSRKLSLRDTGKAIYRSQTTRSGLDRLRTVCCGIVFIMIPADSLKLDLFKDETDQTAAEYCVVSGTDQRLLSSSSSKAPSVCSSPRDPALLGPSTAVPQYIAESRSGSRSNSTNSPWSSSTRPAVQSQLKNVSEAYLLRHFQRQLAPWVSAFHFTVLECSIDRSA